MQVTVLGAGNMGSAFVKQLTDAGHKVKLVTRDQSKAQALANIAGVSVVGATNSAADAEVVVLATGYGDAVEALRSVGSLTGKTILDITNPVSADYMSLTIGHTTSAGEEIAKAFPQANVVKGFNTLFAQVLAAGADFGNGQTVPVYLASDSAAAKATVSAMATSLGFQVIDAGNLKNSRYLEPLAGLNIYLGYGAGRGTSIAPNWIQKA